MDLVVIFISALLIMFSAMFYINSDDREGTQKERITTQQTKPKSHYESDEIVVAYHTNTSSQDTASKQLQLDNKMETIIETASKNLEHKINLAQNTPKTKTIAETPKAPISQAQVVLPTKQTTPYQNTQYAPPTLSNTSTNTPNSNQKNESVQTILNTIMPPQVPLLTSSGDDAPPQIPTLQIPPQQSSNSQNTQTTSQPTTQPTTNTSSPPPTTPVLERPPQIGG